MEFRGLPKAKETAPKRKPRRKGKCCIATDTPEKMEVEERQRVREEKAKKTEENKRKRLEKKNKQETGKKKKKVTTAMALSFSVSDKDISDDDNSDIDGLLEPIDSCDTSNKEISPSEGDYILVMFPCKGKKYYVGKVIKKADEDGDCEVSFYRLSSKANHRFILPNVPDLCSVPISDIKTILPKPTSHAALTKRQQSYIAFNYDFGSFQLG